MAQFYELTALDQVLDIRNNDKLFLLREGELKPLEITIETLITRVALALTGTGAATTGAALSDDGGNVLVDGSGNALIADSTLLPILPTVPGASLVDSQGNFLIDSNANTLTQS